MIYIAGPMTGLPDWNFEAFNDAAEELISQGLKVINPAANNDTTLPYETYMRKAIEALLTCDTILMLSGWEKSNGARMEHMIAVNLGFTIWYGGEG